MVKAMQCTRAVPLASSSPALPAEYVFLSGAPANGARRMIVGDSFDQPRFMLEGTGSYLSFMPELRARGRTLWLSHAMNPFQLTLPRVPLVNYMADPDLYPLALAKAETIARQASGAIFNHPTAILRTRRDVSARILATIPGVRTPRTLRLSAPTRGRLIEAIMTSGLDFPLLIRPAGLHGGEHMVRLDSLAELEAAHIRLGVDDAIYASEFVDFADPDGRYRKLRLVVIGEQVLWRHLIIGERWLLHSDGRAEGVEDEERAALARFETETLPALAPTLAAIRAAVGLDHFGIDCSLRPNGELLVFEANACMNLLDNSTIPPPNMWEAPIAAIRAALLALLERPDQWLNQAAARPGRRAELLLRAS